MERRIFLLSSTIGALLLCISVGLGAYAGNVYDIDITEAEVEPEFPEVTYELANVQIKPEFPGGESAMYEFLGTNIHYPAEAQKQGIQGMVIVSFTIDKDGSVTEAKAVRSPHESLSKEAVRVVLSMPKWSPGINNGVAVKVTYTLPLKFKFTK